MARRTIHTRRKVLAVGLSALAGVAAAPAFAAPRTIYYRALALQNVHTGDSLNAVYWADDYYIPQSLRKIAWLMRDFHSGDIHAIDPKLLDLLVRLKQALGTTEPFLVTSAYRSPITNARLAAVSEGVAAHSLHMQGKAVDLRLRDRPLRQLHAAAVSLRSGGVGYYPSSDFIHVDVGLVRHWVADS